MARLTGSLGRLRRRNASRSSTRPRIRLPPNPEASCLCSGDCRRDRVGAGLAIVFDVLDPRLRRAKDFEEAAGLPVIAFVPRIQIS